MQAMLRRERSSPLIYRPEFYLPLYSHLNPTRGSSATGNLVRSGFKFQQQDISSGVLLGEIEGAPATYFNGQPMAGLPLEAAATNALARDAKDFIVVNDCTKTGGHADPWGGTTAALVDCEDNPATNYIADVTGIAAASTSFSGGAWLKAESGTVTITFAFVDAGGMVGEVLSASIEVGTSWRYLPLVDTFSAGASGDALVAFQGSGNYYAVGATCYADTKRVASPLGFLDEYYSLTTPDCFRGDQGVFYLELYPTHEPDDGAGHHYLRFSGSHSGSASSYVLIYKSSANNLGLQISDGTGNATAMAAANSTNFDKLSLHKIAAKYSASSYKVWLDGALFAQNATPTEIGTEAKNGTNLFSLGSTTPLSPSAVIRNVKYWGADLPTDAELLTMTI